MMKKRSVLLIVVLLLVNLTALTADDLMVRVRIMYTEDKINLSSESKIYVYNQDESRIILRGERVFAIAYLEDTLKLIDDKGITLIQGSSLEI